MVIVGGAILGLCYVMFVYWVMNFKESRKIRRQKKRELLRWNGKNGANLEECKKVLEGIVEENRAKRGSNLGKVELEEEEICVVETILKYMEVKNLYKMEFYASDLNEMREELGKKKEEGWKNRYVGCVLRKISREEISGLKVKKSENGSGRSAKGSVWVAAREE